MKRSLLAIFLAVDASFLACYAFAFFRQEQSEAPPAQIAQDASENPAAVEAPASSAQNASLKGATPTNGDFFSPRAASPVADAEKPHDGKEVIDPKDGKQVMEVAEGGDPKEPLPPIAAFTEAIKTGSLPVTPGTEYFPKPTPSGSHASTRQASSATVFDPGTASTPGPTQARILSAPNPSNISSAIVSPETP